MEHPSDHSHIERAAVRRTLAAIAAGLGLGLGFDLLFFEKLPGISFPIYIMLSLAIALLWARQERREVPRTARFMLPLILFFSWMVFIRAGELMTFLNVVATLYLSGLFVTLIFRPDIYEYSLRHYFWMPLELLLEVLNRCRAMLRPLFASSRFLARHRALPQVLRGVLIALPVLAVFVLLFSSADLVFREFISGLFSFEINGELLARTIWIALVALAFVGLLGLLSFGPARKFGEFGAPNPKPLKQGRFGLVETSILLGSLNVLFFSFILVQLTYLFGGASNVIGDGFTYAEYARKGFFELVAVSGLSFVLIFVTERLMLRAHGQHVPRFKLLAGLLVFQVFIIMISAFKRLQLYQDAYGFTSLRLVSFIFIIWLAVVFCTLLYKIFTNQREQLYILTLFASVMALLVFVNILNVDGFVARKNIQRYEATGKLDVRYLNNLSDDAIIEVLNLLDDSDPRVRYLVGSNLYAKQQQLHDDQQDWQSANATRRAALRKLNQYSRQLEVSKDKWVDPSFRGPGQE